MLKRLKEFTSKFCMKAFQHSQPNLSCVHVFPAEFSCRLCSSLSLHCLPVWVSSRCCFLCLLESFGQNYPEASGPLLLCLLLELLVLRVECPSHSDDAGFWWCLCLTWCGQEADGTLDCISMALTCTFNRWGTLLAVGCNDGRIVIWDFLTRGIAKIISAHIHPVCSLWWDALHSDVFNELVTFQVVFRHPHPPI